MALWAILLAATLQGASVQMDAVGDEVTAGNTREPTSNAHTLFISDHVNASLAVADHWLLGASYTYSATQGVGTSHTPGVDATYVLNEHLAISLAANGTPPTTDIFPLCTTTRRGQSLCAAVSEDLWAVGGNVLASWDSAGHSDFEWGVDAGYAPELFELNFSRARVPGAVGVDADLWQHRIAVGATGRLFGWFDVDLRGADYVYQGNQVLLTRPVLQLSGGLPIAPRKWEAALNLTGHFLQRKLNAKVGVLVAPYASACLGSSSQLSGKLSGVVGPLRLWGSVLFQVDKPPAAGSAAAMSCAGQLGSNPLQSSVSSYASVGADYEF